MKEANRHRAWLACAFVASTAGASCALLANVGEDRVVEMSSADATAPAVDAPSVGSSDGGTTECPNEGISSGWHVDPTFGRPNFGSDAAASSPMAALLTSFEDGTGLYIGDVSDLPDGGTTLSLFDGGTFSPVVALHDRVTSIVASHFNAIAAIAGIGPISLADGGVGGHLDSYLGGQTIVPVALPDLLFGRDSTGPHAVGAAFDSDNDLRVYIVTNVRVDGGGTRPALLTAGGDKKHAPGVLAQVFTSDGDDDGGAPPMVLQTGAAVADVTGTAGTSLNGSKSFWVAGVSADDAGVAEFFPDAASAAVPPNRVRLPFRPDGMTTSIYSGDTGFIVGRANGAAQLATLDLGSTAPTMFAPISLGDLDVDEGFEVLYAQNAITAVSVTSAHDLVLVQWIVTAPDGGALAPGMALPIGTPVKAVVNETFGDHGLLTFRLCNHDVTLGDIGVFGADYYVSVRTIDGDSGVNSLVRITNGANIVSSDK